MLVEQAKFTYWYHILSVFRWTLVLLQIGLGAILTALGAFKQDGKVIVSLHPNRLTLREEASSCPRIALTLVLFPLNLLRCRR